MSTTDKAIKGVHSQTAIVGIRGVLALVYFGIMSRLLTPDDFGYFALLTAVTTILNSLSEAGLGSAVIQRKNINVEFASTAFTLSLALGLFFSLVLFFFASSLSCLVAGNDILTLALKIMSSVIFIQAANNITWALYMRKLDFFKFGILQVSAEALSFILGIMLAWRGFGFYSIVGATVANQIFLAIILLILKKYQFKLMIRTYYIREIIGYGGWLTLTVILRNLTNEIDKVIIGRMLPISALGEINRPQGFVSRISSQVNGIFDTVLFPIISSIQHDSAKIARAYIKIVSIVITCSFILGAVMSLGSKIIINIFFGSQWSHLQPILILFSLAILVHGFSRVADSFFRSLGIVKRYFFARLINWAVFITLVWTGCHYGVVGAAIGSVAGSIISTFIKFLMQRKAVGITITKLFKVVSDNILCPLILFIIGILLLLYTPYGNITGLIWFVVSTLVTIVFFPRLWGSIFNEIIVARYLKRFRRFVIY